MRAGNKMLNNKKLLLMGLPTFVMCAAEILWWIGAPDIVHQINIVACKLNLFWVLFFLDEMKNTTRANARSESN